MGLVGTAADVSASSRRSPQNVRRARPGGNGTAPSRGRGETHGDWSAPQLSCQRLTDGPRRTCPQHGRNCRTGPRRPADSDRSAAQLMRQHRADGHRRIHHDCGMAGTRERGHGAVRRNGDGRLRSRHVSLMAAAAAERGELAKARWERLPGGGEWRCMDRSALERTVAGTVNTRTDGNCIKKRE